MLRYFAENEDTPQPLPIGDENGTRANENDVAIEKDNHQDRKRPNGINKELLANQVHLQTSFKSPSISLINPTQYQSL